MDNKQEKVSEETKAIYLNTRRWGVRPVLDLLRTLDKLNKK